MFEDMLERLREGITSLLSHIELQTDNLEATTKPQDSQVTEETHIAFSQFSESEPLPDNNDETSLKKQPMRYARGNQIYPDNQETWGKVPRNAPCPCGSGSKYKHCHGKLK